MSRNLQDKCLFQLTESVASKYSFFESRRKRAWQKDASDSAIISQPWSSTDHVIFTVNRRSSQDEPRWGDRPTLSFYLLEFILVKGTERMPDGKCDHLTQVINLRWPRWAWNEIDPVTKQSFDYTYHRDNAQHHQWAIGSSWGKDWNQMTFHTSRRNEHSICQSLLYLHAREEFNKRLKKWGKGDCVVDWYRGFNEKITIVQCKDQIVHWNQLVSS